MKQFILASIAISLVLSIVLVRATNSNEGLRIILNRIALAEAGYPALSPKADGPVILLEEYGLEAYQAESRFPGRAIRLYSLFGETPEFREVINRYGYQQVVPIVSYYFENQSPMLDVKRVVGKKLVDSWNWITGKKIKNTSTSAIPLIPSERAWIALLRISESGNGFLGRFAIDKKGNVAVLPLKTGIAIGEEFALGGIEAIERKYLSGIKVTTGDVALGVADAATLVLGVGFFTRFAKASRATRIAVRTRELAGTTRSIFARIVIGMPKALSSRILKWGVVAGGAYVVCKHPEVITSTFGVAAKMIGFPEWLAQTGGWFLIIILLLSPLGFVWSFFLMMWPIAHFVWDKIR